MTIKNQIKIENLELNILSCMLTKPELMKKLKIDEKYFVKYKKIWLFMKAFYQKYQTFDFALMGAVVNNQYKLCEFLEEYCNDKGFVSSFEKYQNELVACYEEDKAKKKMAEDIYLLANNLYLKTISLEDFKNKIDEMYKNFSK